MGRAERKRRSAEPTATSPQCIISSDTNLGRKCARALERVLALNNVEHRALQHHGVSSLQFLTRPLIEAEIGGKSRPVLPLQVDGRWLNVAIDLNFIANDCWRVNHISIRLLQGEASDPSKDQLLRAEWQIQKTTDSSGHAQPHWHVLSAASSRRLPTFDEVVDATPNFEEFVAESEQQSSPRNKAYKHFHYAMVTDWHQRPSTGPCCVLADEAALVSWLEGCIQYILHQLTHVDRKTARQD